MCAPCKQRIMKRIDEDSGSRGTGVVGGYELPDMGAGD